MKLMVVSAALCGVLLAWFSPAAAQSGRTRVAVDYVAPPACPDAARLSDEVSARLGYAGLDPSASRRARVRVFQDGAEHVATLELDATAARSFRSASCEDLVATVASALATELDPGTPIVGAAPVAASDGAQGVRIRVRAEQPGLQLHRVAGQQTAIVATSRGTAYGVGYSFDPICIAPCEREIAPGTERYAVSENGGTPVIIERPIPLEADSELSLSFDSRELERGIGWATFGIGVAAGGGMVIGGLLLATGGSNFDPAAAPSSDGDIGTALLIAGGAVTAVSLGVGLVLAWLGDVARIDVQPLRF